MIKVPTFIIGGFLVLTGLIGYLIQDPGLTLKLKGPLASNASFILSDGVDKHELDFIPCPESAGENVWWIAHKLNEDHARVASQKNFATENGANDNDLHSFWYASSRGETMKGLLLESERYNTAGSGNEISIDWTKIDVNSSSLRIIYKNAAGNEGPATLTSNNWENVALDPLPAAGEELTFSKSWTAFIPGIIGLLLIILAQGADMVQKARKHIMHVAVLVGLLGFIVSAGKIGTAVAEMNWLKGEPYGIIHASMLKPLSMLLTSGLLFIYVLLCIISFINARKEIAANAKAEAEKKKEVLRKVKKKNESVELKKEKVSKKPAVSSSNQKANISDSDRNKSEKKAADQKSPQATSSSDKNKEDSKVKKPSVDSKLSSQDSVSKSGKEGEKISTSSGDSVKKSSQDNGKKTEDTGSNISKNIKEDARLGQEKSIASQTTTPMSVSPKAYKPVPEKGGATSNAISKDDTDKAESSTKPRPEISETAKGDFEKPVEESKQYNKPLDKKDSSNS
ncbi:MAG: hypothetical protein P8N49_08300 [Opitutales bacterium]|nr:hypothetical protein [Opitutales bacterium]